LYLTDSEATRQAIIKWIGGGAKLSLAKTAGADILSAIVINLQKRVKAKAVTLLIKVKRIADAHSTKGRTSEPRWD
jgi:hypothetical protein